MTPLKFPISALSLLIPELNLTAWIDRGISFLEDLLVGPALKTFRTLQLKYKLLSTEYYKYMQIAHLVRVAKQLQTSLPRQLAQYYAGI